MTSQSCATGEATRSVRVGQWLLLLVALSGLMAMHGFSDHGTRGSVEPPQHPMTHGYVAMAGPATHPDHTRALAGATVTVGEVRVGTAGWPVDGHDGHDGALAGTCLAVMAGLVLLVVSRWPHRVRATLGDALLVAGVSALRLRTRSRRPAPPDLTLLAVQRC